MNPTRGEIERAGESRLDGFAWLELVWLLLGLTWCKRHLDDSGQFPELLELHREVAARVRSIERE